MGDNESKFQIKIRTDLEGTGMKAAAEQMEEIKTATKEANASVVQASGSLDESGESGKKSGTKIHEGADEAALSHHELKEAVRATAAQFGGLADVGLWLNPMLGGLAAALLAFEKLKEAVNEGNEAVAHLAESMAAIDEAKLKALADAAQSAADSINAAAIEQEKLNSAYAHGDTAMESRIKQYGAEKDAILKVAEAKEQTFEADIQQQITLGKITKEAGNAAIESAKLRLEQQRGANDQAKLAVEIQERQFQLANARNRLDQGVDRNAIATSKASETALSGKAAASEEAARQAESAPISGTFTNLMGEQQGFDGTREDTKKEIQGLRGAQQSNEEQGGEVAAAYYKRSADSLQELLDHQGKYIENLKHVAELDKEALDRAKGKTEIAVQQEAHDHETVRTGQDHVDTLQQQYDLQARTNQQVEEQHHRAAAIRTGTEQTEESHRVQAGQGTPLENQEALDRVTQQAGARMGDMESGRAVRQITARVNDIANSLRSGGPMGQQEHGEDMQALMQGMDTLIGIVSHIHTSAGGNRSAGIVNEQLRAIMQRISLLESQISTARSN